MNHKLIRAVLAVAPLALACVPLKDPRKVYKIERWTRNETACDVEGAPYRRNFDDRFGVNPEPAEMDGGTPFAIAASCDYSDCVRRTNNSSADSWWRLDRVSDQLYTHEEIIKNFDECVGTIETQTLTLVDGEARTFRMEIRRHPYSIVSTTCSDEEKRAAAVTCNYLEVIQGPFERDKDASAEEDLDWDD